MLSLAEDLKTALGKKERDNIKVKKRAIKILQAEVVLAEKNIAGLEQAKRTVEHVIKQYEAIKKSTQDLLSIIEKDLGEDADLDEK